jgi:hypothetical protein
MSLHIKMSITFALNATLTVLMAVIPVIISDENTSYCLELIMIILFGTAVAILQATLYGVAGPVQSWTNNLMVGVGISSLLMNILRMIFLAVVPNY